MTAESTIALPGCDVSIPVMGLGTWAWGDRATWGMNGYDQSYNFETIRAAYARSVDAGVTLLDTAEMCSQMERGAREQKAAPIARADSPDSRPTAACSTRPRRLNRRYGAHGE